jgi:hypothetical protein
MKPAMPPTLAATTLLPLPSRRHSFSLPFLSLPPTSLHLSPSHATRSSAAARSCHPAPAPHLRTRRTARPPRAPTQPGRAAPAGVQVRPRPACPFPAQGYTVAATCPRAYKVAFAARVLSQRRHRWTSRFEAHLWDKHCLVALHNKKKGRQGVYCELLLLSKYHHHQESIHPFSSCSVFSPKRETKPVLNINKRIKQQWWYYDHKQNPILGTQLRSFVSYARMLNS